MTPDQFEYVESTTGYAMCVVADRVHITCIDGTHPVTYVDTPPTIVYTDTIFPCTLLPSGRAPVPSRYVFDHFDPYTARAVFVLRNTTA